MPRPLIIKVDGHHVSQHNKKAIGSIDIDLLQENKAQNMHTDLYNNESNSYVPSSVDENPEANENKPKSIVRNLIIRYECTSTKPINNIIKSKSKSVADLRPSPVNATISDSSKITQDDALYNKKTYAKEEEQVTKKVFDFKTIWSKFETAIQHKATTEEFKDTLIEKQSKEIPSLIHIKEKAKILLDDRENLADSWERQVIDLLHEIIELKAIKASLVEENQYQIKKSEEEDMSDKMIVTHPDEANGSGINKPDEENSPNIHLEQTTDEKTQLESVNETENINSIPRKVKDIKNLFENQFEDKKHFSRSISMPFEQAEPQTPEENDDTNNTIFTKYDITQKVPLKYFGKQEEEEDVQENGTNAILSDDFATPLKVQGLKHSLMPKNINTEEANTENGVENDVDVISDMQA